MGAGKNICVTNRGMSISVYVWASPGSPHHSPLNNPCPASDVQAVADDDDNCYIFQLYIKLIESFLALFKVGCWEVGGIKIFGNFPDQRLNKQIQPMNKWKNDKPTTATYLLHFIVGIYSCFRIFLKSVWTTLTIPTTIIAPQHVSSVSVSLA